MGCGSFTAPYMYICITLQSNRKGKKPQQIEGSNEVSLHLYLLWLPSPDLLQLTWSDAVQRSLNAGRCAVSEAQHWSMSRLHSGSHEACKRSSNHQKTEMMSKKKSQYEGNQSERLKVVRLREVHNNPGFGPLAIAIDWVAFHNN